MNLFRKGVSATIALLMTVVMFNSALAATGDVTVSITSDGVLSTSINDHPFGSHPYSLSPRTFPAEMVVNASDMRGTATGWHVTITATDFVDTTPGSTKSFPVSNFSMYGGWVYNSQPSGHASNAAPGVNTVPAIAPAGISSNVMVAVPGTGAGHYKTTYAASLTVPGGTLVGSYKSTLTVTISGAQP